MTDGQEINRLKLENASLKKKTLLAETELAIIKGIGNNSPEMKSLKSEVEALKSQLALDREDAQVQILRLEKRNSEHQKLNGELQVKLSQYEDKAAHYRRKAIL
jgi:capsule polysaccharide export protein KpsE/RkpR